MRRIARQSLPPNVNLRICDLHFRLRFQQHCTVPGRGKGPPCRKNGANTGETRRDARGNLIL